MCNMGTSNQPRRLTNKQQLAVLRERIDNCKIDLADLKAEEKALERKMLEAGEDISREET